MSKKLPDDTMLSVVANYPKTEQHRATNISDLTQLQGQSSEGRSLGAAKLDDSGVGFLRK